MYFSVSKRLLPRDTFGMLCSKASQGMVFLANESKIVSGRENTVRAIWQIKHCFHMNAVIAKRIKERKKPLY